MTHAKKLQLPSRTDLHVIGAPPKVLDKSIDLTDQPGGPLLVFAKDSAALDPHWPLLQQSARADRLTWVAYPKAKKMGTDLNRDILVAMMEGSGIHPVRMVSLDETWSAMRLRPDDAE